MSVLLVWFSAWGAGEPRFRAAQNHTPGVRTFYIGSESRPGLEYVVQSIHCPGQCRWFFDCADFKFRRLARKRHCKHLRLLAALARLAHGASKLAALDGVL